MLRYGFDSHIPLQIKWAGMFLGARLPCKKSVAGFDSHTVHQFKLPVSSIGLGSLVFNQKSRVRFPVRVPIYVLLKF